MNSDSDDDDEEMFSVVVNGVEIVSYEDDLDYNKYNNHGGLTGEWGTYEPTKEFYPHVSFIVYDNIMEHYRTIYAARKGDLGKVFEMLYGLDPNYSVECSKGAYTAMLEHIMGLPDFPE